jgi:putative ABC transport system permease protein
MKVERILAFAWRNMKQRRLRTSLTTLGVVVGITAIIGIAALGEGFRVGIKNRMQQGFELDILVIIPGSFTAGIGEFEPQDLENVRNVSGVELAAAVITIPEASLYNHEGTKLNALTVAGVNFSEITSMLPERLVPLEGEIPLNDVNDTIILGYKACFLNETESLVKVGENVTLQIKARMPYPPYSEVSINKTFTVAAILGKSGTPGLTNFDYWAFIPMGAAVNITRKEAYNIILAKVSDPEQSEEIAREIEDTFENPYAVSILVPVAFMRQVDNILNFVQLFLTAIASLSLLVAGLGIMNIMTVSVMERTREIGIMKAIGAKDRTVLLMFLSEAILIGVIGGLIGVLAGFGLSHVLAYMISSFMRPQGQNTAIRAPETGRLEIAPLFTPEWAIFAVLFGIVVCIIFGLYPARKAAKLNPVEALRYE